LKRFVEFRWILEGFEPDTIPMKRLTEYMHELCRLYGDNHDLRFARVENKCVAVDVKVPRDKAGKVRVRIEHVRSDLGAPREAVIAHDRINEMLAQDGKTARIQTTGAVILRFPGVQSPDDDVLKVKGPASLIGYLYYLTEDMKGVVKARLRVQTQSDKQRSVDATCDALFASEFKTLMFETIRVTGTADWCRTRNGEWIPSSVHITNAHRIENRSLRQAVERLRKVNAGWVENPIAFQKHFDKDERG